MLKTLPTTKTTPLSDTSASDQTIVLVAKGGGIAFAGSLFVYVLRFGFGIIVARFLGTDRFGLYSLSTTAAEIASVLALFGFSAVMTRYIPIAHEKKDEGWLWEIIHTGIGVSLLSGLIFAVGLFLLARPLSLHAYRRPDLIPVLRLISLSIPLLTVMNILVAISQGFKRMEYVVYSQDIAFNVGKLVFSVVLLQMGWSVMGATTAYIVSSIAPVVMLFYFVNRLFPLNRPWHTGRRNIGEMLRFSLPLYLSQVVRQFGGNLETLVLGSFGVMSGVGVYAAALRLSSIGNMFYYALMAISTPVISALYSRGDTDQLNRFYQTTTKWAMAFNLPIFVTIALFAGPLMLVFGDGFVSGAPGLIILAFAALFNAGTGFCGTIVTMTGHSGLTLANSVIDLVASIVLALLFIPRWGVVGAATGATLAVVLVNVLRTIQVFVLLRIWPYNKSFVKPLAAALAAAAAGYLSTWRLKWFPALVQLVIGAGAIWSVYVLVLILLKLSEEDRLVLERLSRRLGLKRSK